MLRSFKNLELLRYYVGMNFEKSFRSFTKQSEEKNEQLASTVFSTALSLIASFLSTKYVHCLSTIKNILIIVVVFVVGFILSYNVYLFAYRKLSQIKRSFKKYKRKTSAIEIKEMIDNFDHIACDNVLIAEEFIQHFDSKRDSELSTFYYFEVIYYAKIATEKTLKVLNNPNTCINSKVKTDAIDLFRIYNLCKILERILEFIKENEHNINIEKKTLPLLQAQIDLLSQNIAHAVGKCTELINNECS